MSVESGKYYAVPVQDNDPAFELDVDFKPDLRVITAQRISLSAGEPVNEIDAIKGQVKDSIAEVKKGGWKSALNLAKKFVEDSMKDEREKRAERDAANYKDPMDPKNAFAFPDASQVKYEPIHLMEDKNKDSDLFQFRTDSSYGVLMPLEDGVFREISFSFPSHEYAEKHYPEQHVGHSVTNWRREDDLLHKMRIHYLSKDKTKAEAAARAADFSKEKSEYFEVDMSSTRAGEKTRFSAPRLKLDPRTGELSLNFLSAWYLPTKTKAGRQIQYNWDALRITITQGDKLIRRKVCWSSNKGHEYIKSLNNQMELMDGGYLGEFTEGQYEFRVSVYNEELMVYPFEVKRIDSTDTRTDPATYYVLDTPRDKFVETEYNKGENYLLYFKYPARTLAEKYGSEEKVKIECEVLKDGKSWLPYDLSESEADSMFDDFEIRNNIRWLLLEPRLGVPFGIPPAKGSRNREYTAPEEGKYTIVISINGNEESRFDVEITDEGETLRMDESTFPDLPIADFEFTEEHDGPLFRINR